MAKRQVIEIDRDKCNGCGLCITACAEGALALDDENKAVVVNEIYCDGLGACLDVCPVDALKVIEKDSTDYNPQATYDHVLKTRGKEAAMNVHGVDQQEEVKKESAPLPSGCPGSMAQEIKKNPVATASPVAGAPDASELTQWPIQLHLVSPMAPYFNETDLLIAADCTAFALGSFHQDLLKGKKVVIACPKLDDTEGYLEKLTELFKNNTIYSITVAIMVVPCCTGLFYLVKEAVEQAGLNIPVKKVVIGIDGEIS